MTDRNTATEPLPRHIGAKVVATLPEHDYTTHYQPEYPKTGALVEAVHELHYTEAVTTPRQVDELQGELTRLANGETDTPIIITGRCAEEVNLETSIDTLVEQAMRTRAVALSGLGKALVVLRNRGQNTKPRSAALERLPDGRTLPSYMGDAVNSIDSDHRAPDPSRMVAAAIQARDLEAGLTEAASRHVPAAHEALLLPYEQSFVRVDPDTDKKYLLSADLPWIGKRTNQVDGKHVELLADVENPIGIKIGADSTPEHVAALAQKLNRENRPGKLVLMLRVGRQNTEVLSNVLSAIKTHAPSSIIMYDIHGVTRTAPTGQKIRYVGDIIEDIKTTAAACRKTGLKLHGLHLETTTDNSRLECVDEPDQLPTHPGGVDPQLNPRQTEEILAAVKDYLL